MQIEKVVPRQRKLPSVHSPFGTEVLAGTGTDDADEAPKLVTSEVENVEGTEALEVLGTAGRTGDVDDCSNVDGAADELGVELAIISLEVAGAELGDAMDTDTVEGSGEADGAVEATDEAGSAAPARGFPSQGCLISLAVPSGCSTTRPGFGYNIDS